jgi:hypothetical protein
VTGIIDFRRQKSDAAEKCLKVSKKINIIDTETLLDEVFKAPEIVKKEERKLEHKIYQTNQSIQNLKQKYFQ